MPEASKTNGLTSVLQLLLGAAAFVVIVAGMRVASAILVPFLLAVFIAIISAPPFFWLQRKGVPRIISLLIVVAVVIALGLGITQLIGSSIEDFSRQLPEYQQKLKGQTSAFLQWVNGLGFAIPEKGVQETFNPGAAMKFAAGMLSGLGGVLTNTFLIIITVIFILLEASSFPGKIRATLDRPDESMGYFKRFLHDVQHYMALKTVISLVTGAFVALWLFILGIDFPLLWGLLAFLLNYVPNIGSIIAAVPAVLLALIQFGVAKALAAAGGYVAVNVVMGNIVEPKVMGKGLGLSTLVVFLSLVFWGWVLGLVGMLLAVPLTMMVKIALDSNESTRPIAVLLGPEMATVKQKEEDTQPEEEDSANGD